MVKSVLVLLEFWSFVRLAGLAEDEAQLALSRQFNSAISNEPYV